MKKGAGLLFTVAAACSFVACQNQHTPLRTSEFGLESNQAQFEVVHSEPEPGVVETLRNTALGTPRRLENLSATEESTFLSIPERSQVNEELALLASARAKEFFPNAELQLVSVRHGARFSYVTFEQTHLGRPVHEARLIVRLDSEGNWSTQSSTLAGEELLQTVSFAEPCSPTDDLVTRLLGITARIRATEQVVFIRHSETGSEAEATAAHRIVADVPGLSPEVWLWVSDTDQRLLAVHNPIAKVSREFSVSGSVFSDHPGSPTVAMPFPFVTIDLANGSRIQANNAGVFQLPENVTSGKIRLENAHMRIVDEKSPTTAAHFEISPDASTIPLDEQLSPEVRNIYYWLNVTRQFVRDELKYDGLQYQMLVQANFGERFDNAFFMPLTLSLAFGQGDRFLKNTAHSRDIIIHEFGHAFTHDVYGQTTGYEFSAMNEAMSDYLAATITNDPLIADGAMIGRSYMRTVESNMRYPENYGGQYFHNDGQLFSGSIWRVRKALGAKHADALFHEARLAQAKTVFEFYREMMKIEERKSDLNHFTINDTQRAIMKAFKAHGLGAPGVSLAQKPAEDLTIPWSAQGCFSDGLSSVAEVY